MNLRETVRKLFGNLPPEDRVASMRDRVAEKRAELEDARNEVAAQQTELDAANAAAILTGDDITISATLQKARAKVSGLEAAITALEAHVAEVEKTERDARIREIYERKMHFDARRLQQLRRAWALALIAAREYRRSSDGRLPKQCFLRPCAEWESLI